MNYENKETGQIVQLAEIEKEFKELMANTNEFNEYLDRFDDFLSDYYVEVKNEL